MMVWETREASKCVGKLRGDCTPLPNLLCRHRRLWIDPSSSIIHASSFINYAAEATRRPKGRKKGLLRCTKEESGGYFPVSWQLCNPRSLSWHYRGHTPLDQCLYLHDDRRGSTLPYVQTPHILSANRCAPYIARSRPATEMQISSSMPHGGPKEAIAAGTATAVPNEGTVCASKDGDMHMHTQPARC